MTTTQPLRTRMDKCGRLWTSSPVGLEVAIYPIDLKRLNFDAFKRYHDRYQGTFSRNGSSLKAGRSGAFTTDSPSGLGRRTNPLRGSGASGEVTATPRTLGPD